MEATELDIYSPAVEAKYRQALAGLADNTRYLLDFPHPVLIEGGAYPGIWLECGPLEGAVYGRFFPEVAIANHEIFFQYQREDGWLPYNLRADQRVGFSQIQMVVPIAATAWETAQATGREDFLAKAYAACGRWDAWLMANRNTRGSGLCELFCEYDTGHDHSPRVRDLPRACPGGDARHCANVRDLPWLAPDLSATVYGGRVALAAMAAALGHRAEAAAWQERAEMLRATLVRTCYDPRDAFFYDVDRAGNFNRVRGDVITRVFGEHVPDPALFEQIYQRHIKDPQAFWTPYPLPSIAANDPSFDHALPLNSWGGAAQALTALRAPRWMNHYGKADDLRHLMTRWVPALLIVMGLLLAGCTSVASTPTPLIPTALAATISPSATTAAAPTVLPSSTPLAAVPPPPPTAVVSSPTTAVTAAPPQPIRFDASAVSAVVTGRLEPGVLKRYIFSALKGQIVTVELTVAPDPASGLPATITVTGADGSRLIPEPTTRWKGTLLASQEYTIAIRSLSQQAITYKLLLAIPAIGSTPYIPVPLALCQSFQEMAGEALKISFQLAAKAPFKDELTGETGESCTLTASATGKNFESPAQVTTRLAGAMLGFTEVPAYRADGPAGAVMALGRDSALLLIQVNWVPAPGVKCPSDQPISACALKPEQKLYTVIIQAAMK